MSLRPYSAELAHLQTFLAVCRLGTIGRAAKHLKLSQPALSAHLNALEKGMGRKLLIRSPRGVCPTPAGVTLRYQIELHLDQLDTVATTNLDMKGLAVIGGPADLLSMQVLPALKPLYQAGLHVKVRTGIAEDLLGHLAADELDLVIATRWPAERMDLKFEPLYEEEYVLVGNKAWHSRLANLSPGKLVEALATTTFVAFDEQLPLIRDHPLISQHLRDIFGYRTGDHVALYTPDLRALREAAIAGIGVTVLPRYIVAEALAAQQLFECKPPHPRFNTIYTVNQQGPLHPRLQQIKETLQSAAAQW